MRSDSQTPGSASEWLARAKGDLALAKSPLPDGAFLEDYCFHAQQAAEKGLKAIYQRHEWPFRYTHDLEELTSGLERLGLSVPAAVVDAIALTSFAWESRYPGFGEPVTAEEYNDAIRHAEAVVAWAAAEVGE